MKNYKKGCILIIGQLRFHLLNKKFFENHKKDFDFFAVIDSSSEEKIKDLSFIKEFFIIEKNLKELNNQKKLLKINDGRKLLQWQKLKIGYQLIEKYTKHPNAFSRAKNIKKFLYKSFDVSGCFSALI